MRSPHPIVHAHWGHEPRGRRVVATTFRLRSVKAAATGCGRRFRGSPTPNLLARIGALNRPVLFLISVNQRKLAVLRSVLFAVTLKVVASRCVPTPVTFMRSGGPKDWGIHGKAANCDWLKSRLIQARNMLLDWDVLGKIRVSGGMNARITY